MHLGKNNRWVILTTCNFNLNKKDWFSIVITTPHLFFSVLIKIKPRKEIRAHNVPTRSAPCILPPLPKIAILTPLGRRPRKQII